MSPPKRTHSNKSNLRQKSVSLKKYYTNPCAIIASATFTKPAMFAPAT